jgi:hypothetical protein
MRSILARSTLGVAAFLLLVAGTASASASAVLEVKIPFPFVVRGQSFPAGHYTVQREDMTSSVLLIHGDRGNKTTASTFVATMPAAGQDPAGHVPALLFTRVENQYRLSGVWESGSEGQTIVN